MRRSTLLAAAVVAVIIALLAVYMNSHKRLEGASELVDERFSKLVEGVPRSLEVIVEGISPEGFIDPAYTCDGDNIPPKVTITGIPDSASYVALIMYDPDAPGGTFIHWLAVEPAKGSQAIFPGQAVSEGFNDFGKLGYGGPCPPKGHGAHRYFFLVLALSGDPQLPPGYKLDDLLDAVEGKVAAWGYAMGKYSR